MEDKRYYVGLDVSDKLTALCIVDYDGQIIKETMVDTDPKSIDEHLQNAGFTYEKIGIESNNTAIWLYWELTKAGYPVIAIETHHTSCFMKAQNMKTDKNDARGIAEMMRGGFYKEVHIKSDESQRFKLLVNNRRFMVKQRVDLENQIRGSLKTFGLKTGEVTEVQYGPRIHELIDGDGELEAAVLPLLEQRNAGLEHIKGLDKLLRTAAKNDPVCQLLMTAPGVGPLTAILYKSVIDDPTRFKRSKDVPCHLGLTPKKYASGETDRNLGITKAGDAMLRSYLYNAACSLMQKSSRPCELKSWGRDLHKRSSYKNAAVAVARKLSIAMHRMWMDGTEFDWSNQDQDSGVEVREVELLEAA